MTEIRIVVGSGPNAVAVTHALLDRGYPVTMLDVGETLDPATIAVVERMARQEPEQWSAADQAYIQRVEFNADPALSPKRLFGSSFAYYVDPRLESPADMRLYGSHALGGLSNVWGCALIPTIAGNLADWPQDVANGINAAQPKLRDLVLAITGSDILARETHLKISTAAQRILGRYRAAPEDKAVDIFATPLAIARECKACNCCMYGCVYGYTYNSKSDIEQVFARNPRFRYIGGVAVTRFSESTEGVAVEAARDGRSEIIHGRQAFLAAGMMGTLRIVWNSLPGVARLVYARDATTFLLPGLMASPVGKHERHHGLSHLSADLHAPPFADKPAHFQLYFNNPAVADGLKAKLPLLRTAPMGILADFANRFLITAQGYLHSDFCHRLRLEIAGDGVIKASAEINPDNARFTAIALARFTAAMRRYGAYFVKPAASVIPYGGSKSAGALPHAHEASPTTTDRLGRPLGAANVFVVDATVLPSIPGRNHTLTMMANALRIGQTA